MYALIIFASFVIVSIVFFILLYKMPLKKIITIQDDKYLRSFYFEMNNNANDGWTKLHNKELYYSRLELLLARYNVHIFWWKLYLFMEKTAKIENDYHTKRFNL